MQSSKGHWRKIMGLLLAISMPGLAMQAGARQPDAPPNYGQIQQATFEGLSGGFSQPDMIYGPFTFWFWDEPLDAGIYPAKAGTMARKMMEQGLNPGYAHPRRSGYDIFGPGVMKPSPSLPKDQWLSPAWFDAFKAALQAAEAGNGYLSYVDEYMWPIGRAAGRVLKNNPELVNYSVKWKIQDVAGGATAQLPESFFTVVAQLSGEAATASAADSMEGEWIWQAEANAPGTFYFRKAFDLSEGQTVASAVARITVDNAYELFVNGTAAGSGDDWHIVGKHDVASLLRPGRNVIAIKGSGDGFDALLFDLTIALSDGQTVDVRSDGSWIYSKSAAEGWNQLAFAAADWKNVRVAGPADMSPWNLPETQRVYAPATVRSATLRPIGAGEPFTWTAPPEGRWRIYSFIKMTGADVNVLNKSLAKAFIGLSHQPYMDYVGASMGKAIPGVFCDTEGGYGNGNGIPWSDDLVERYRTVTGRDIRLWMPLLFDDDVEGLSARARVDWFNAMSDLYSGFHAEISDWLEVRGLYYIANLWEESLQWQTSMVGDHMKNQRGFSMPGTDCLQLKAYDVHDFKEAQAVAEFEGRRLMSEIMGAGNWGTFNPITMKESVNSVVAWGVGHVVPHGIFMTRDLDHNPWTPDWYDENPFWSNLHLWSDFTRRASYVNSHGRAVPEVLLLNPVESVWALLGQTDKLWGPAIHGIGTLDQLYSPEVQNINNAYGEAMRQLTSHRVEYLITDAYYMDQMAIEGSQLVRDDFQFKAVVMPPMAVMQRAQAQKLLEFAKAGGRVYALGALPTGSTENGLHDPAMAALMNELQSQPTVKACTQGLTPDLEANAPGLESPIRLIEGQFPMLQYHRRIDGRDFYWLVNNSTEARQCVAQVAGAAGAASVWDCETGEIHPVASTQTEAGSRIQLAFLPHEAYWLVFDPKAPAHTEPVMALPAGKTILQFPTDGWNVRVEPAVQPNLQHAVAVAPALTAAEGVKRGLTLWDSWDDLPKNFSGLVDYTQTVDLPQFQGDALLDLGTVNHIAEVWVNGERIGAKLWPPHQFPTGALRPGKNTIQIRVGNLINNNYGMASPSGLLGPVTVKGGL